MNIIGQDKVIDFIKSNNISTIPHTILLEGEYGSGKHSICKFISETYSLEIEDISENLTYEKIEQINLSVSPKIYIIDTSSISVKNENAILKFLEEPLKNALIILLTENKYSLIDTIRNRCYLITLEKYSSECLKSFMKDESNIDMFLKVCNTPGDVLLLQQHSIDKIIELCNKIFNSIDKASYGNTLSLSDRIAFKDEKDKYNFNLFFKLLVIVSYERVLNNLPNSISEYQLTRDYFNRIKIKNIDKKMLFENYLLKLKKSRRR